jgi:alkylated DNA repair dioxygenase AlkB
MHLTELGTDLLGEVAFHLIAFKAADRFAGPWKGRVFKMGPLGLGYYSDDGYGKHVLAMMRLCATSKAIRAMMPPADMKQLSDAVYSPKVLLDGTAGAQLVETSFRAHYALIGMVVIQAAPDYEVEPEIVVYGKTCHQPRDVQFRSDESKGYFYSNQLMQSKPLTPEMRELLGIVNVAFGARYNGILINRYRNGSKTVGAHADSEAGLNANAGVVAISHGATRTFRVRDIKTKGIVGNYPARHHMALQMRGPFQKHYTHEIPQEKKIMGVRVSLTFRQHDPAAEAGLAARVLGKRSREED